MAATPVVRQIAWNAYLVFVVFLGLATWLGTRFTPLTLHHNLVLALLLYYALGWLLRMRLGRYQNQGMKRVHQGEFLEAIPWFEKSYSYFTARPWLDKWRFWLMLSTSQMGYREMALNNIAFCYSQLGDGQQARTYYRQLLTEYPGNGLATAALRLLDAGRN